MAVTGKANLEKSKQAAREALDKMLHQLPDTKIRNDGAIKGKVDLGDHVLIERHDSGYESVSVEQFISSDKYARFGPAPQERLNKLKEMPVLNESKLLQPAEQLLSFVADRQPLYEQKVYMLARALEKKGTITADGLRDVYGDPRKGQPPIYAELKVENNKTAINQRIDTFIKQTLGVWTREDVMLFNEQFGNDLSRPLPDKDTPRTLLIPNLTYKAPSATDATKVALAIFKALTTARAE